MSLENIETLRRVIDAYNARDVDAFVTYFDSDSELHSAFSAVGGAMYRGHDGLREFFRDFEDAWAGEVRIEPETYFDLGERLLLFYVLHGRGRHSGAMVEMPNALLSTWRGGVILHLKAYAHREDAVADSGVPFEHLHPIAP